MGYSSASLHEPGGDLSRASEPAGVVQVAILSYASACSQTGFLVVGVAFPSQCLSPETTDVPRKGVEIDLEVSVP